MTTSNSAIQSIVVAAWPVIRTRMSFPLASKVAIQVAASTSCCTATRL